MKLRDTLKERSPYHPLEDFYTTGGMRLPELTRINGENIPRPYYYLLVHNRDMTSKLEEFHRQTIHIKVLKLKRKDGVLTRQVVLTRDNDNQPVEFGSISINLKQFSGKVHDEIIECWKPFGGILNEYKIPYLSKPSIFFSVKSDGAMNEAFGLTDSHTLYGRCNKLINTSRDTLAEVVEILPPLNIINRSRKSDEFKSHP